MRLIDANALLEKLDALSELFRRRGENEDKGFLAVQCGVIFAAEEVNDAPTVDAVEVVRCRDCKYAKPVPKAKAPYIADGTFCCLVQRGDETYGVSVVWADGYCDEGEREDGEHGE